MRPEFGRTQYLHHQFSTQQSSNGMPNRRQKNILFRRRGLDLECDRRRIRVTDYQSLGDLDRERTCTCRFSNVSQADSCHLVAYASQGIDTHGGIRAPQARSRQTWFYKYHG